MVFVLGTAKATRPRPLHTECLLDTIYRITYFDETLCLAMRQRYGCSVQSDSNARRFSLYSNQLNWQIPSANTFRNICNISKLYSHMSVILWKWEFFVCASPQIVWVPADRFALIGLLLYCNPIKKFETNGQGTILEPVAYYFTQCKIVRLCVRSTSIMDFSIKSFQLEPVFVIPRILLAPRLSVFWMLCATRKIIWKNIQSVSNSNKLNL